MTDLRTRQASTPKPSVKKDAIRMPTTIESVVPRRREIGPWCPTFIKTLDPGNSILDRESHRRYVAIISNFLNPVAEFRFPSNADDLAAMDSVLNEERKKFHDRVLSHLKRTQPNRFNSLPCKDAMDCITKRALKRCKEGMADLAFYRESRPAAIVKWSTNVNEKMEEGEGDDFDRLSIDEYQTESPDGLKVQVEVLHEGDASLLRLPDPRAACQFPAQSAAILRHLDKFAAPPIEQDSRMETLAFDNRIEFLMDASTLRHLMCESWQQRQQKFVIRLSITKQHQGATRRLCTFSKPMLCSPIQRPYAARQYLKWMVKATIQQSPLEQRSAEVQNPVQEKDKQQMQAENVADELAASVFSSNTVISGHSGKSDKTGQQKNSGWAQYSVVQLDTEKKYSILVRATNHGTCAMEEGTGKRRISFTVHPEYLPELGAESLPREEVLWEIITALLKGSDEHLTFRVHPSTGHYLQMSRKTTSLWISQETPEIRMLLAERTERVRHLLEAVGELPTGQYLLVRGGDGKLGILPSIDCTKLKGTQQKKMPLDSAFLELACCPRFEKAPAPEAAYNGVDPHYPLQWHIVRGCAPGAFPPAPENKPTSSANGGGDGSKGNAANFFQQQEPAKRKSFGDSSDQTGSSKKIRFASPEIAKQQAQPAAKEVPEEKEKEGVSLKSWGGTQPPTSFPKHMGPEITSQLALPAANRVSERKEKEAKQDDDVMQMEKSAPTTAQHSSPTKQQKEFTPQDEPLETIQQMMLDCFEELLSRLSRENSASDRLQEQLDDEVAKNKELRQRIAQKEEEKRQAVSEWEGRELEKEKETRETIAELNKQLLEKAREVEECQEELVRVKREYEILRLRNSRG